MTDKEKNSWSDSLDDMLTKLNDGAFSNSSLNEFSKVVNDTLGNPHIVRPSADAYASKAATSYTETKPLIESQYEDSLYGSRYDQVDNCLRHLVYPTNYNSDKAAGHKAAVSQYLQLIGPARSDLRPVEKRLADDILTCQQKLIHPEPYIQGYYDALLLIRKIFYNSKLARLQELSAITKKR